jgi:hypothetical protein
VKRALATVLAAAAIPAVGQVTDLAYSEAPSCKANEIPLGQPARVEAKSVGARLEVKVAANFGCGTTAGNARVEEPTGEIRLYADTILPGYPTPACKCTRHLEYRFTPTGLARRIVFYKDGRVEGEGTLD